MMQFNFCVLCSAQYSAYAIARTSATSGFEAVCHALPAATRCQFALLHSLSRAYQMPLLRCKSLAILHIVTLEPFDIVGSFRRQRHYIYFVCFMFWVQVDFRISASAYRTAEHAKQTRKNAEFLVGKCFNLYSQVLYKKLAVAVCSDTGFMVNRHPEALKEFMEKQPSWAPSRSERIRVYSLTLGCNAQNQV